MSTTHARQRIAPLVLILRLLRRLYVVAPEFSLSLGLLLGWTRDEIAERNACAAAAQAVDDPLEAVRARVEAALANDSAATRRAILRAIDEAHARSERLARRLAVTVAPEELTTPRRPEAL